MMEIPQDYVDIRNAYFMSNGNKDFFRMFVVMPAQNHLYAKQYIVLWNVFIKESTVAVAVTRGQDYYWQFAAFFTKLLFKNFKYSIFIWIFSSFLSFKFFSGEFTFSQTNQCKKPIQNQV